MNNKRMSETIADIVDAMRNEGHTGEASCLEWIKTKMTYYADRIEAAAKREREANREKSSQVGNAAKMREAWGDKDEVNNMLRQAADSIEREAAKDAEIAELRECLREAVREQCPFTRMSCRYGEQCDYECGTEKWRNALKGSNNATK